MACRAKMAENKTKSTKISACVYMFIDSLPIYLYASKNFTPLHVIRIFIEKPFVNRSHNTVECGVNAHGLLAKYF